MNVYVRLGIRLLYKGFKSSAMERQKSIFPMFSPVDTVKQLLRSLSIKQGRKYDNPMSAREIQGFIDFHQLDTTELLLPIEDYKTYSLSLKVPTIDSMNSSIVNSNRMLVPARPLIIQTSSSPRQTAAASFSTKSTKQKRSGSKAETSLSKDLLVRHTPTKRTNSKAEHWGFLD
jgi:hypothetical protein